MERGSFTSPGDSDILHSLTLLQWKKGIGAATVGQNWCNGQSYYSS